MRNLLFRLGSALVAGEATIAISTTVADESSVAGTTRLLTVGTLHLTLAGVFTSHTAFIDAGLTLANVTTDHVTLRPDAGKVAAAGMLTKQLAGTVHVGVAAGHVTARCLATTSVDLAGLGVLAAGFTSFVLTVELTALLLATLALAIAAVVRRRGLGTHGEQALVVACDLIGTLKLSLGELRTVSAGVSDRGRVVGDGSIEVATAGGLEGATACALGSGDQKLVLAEAAKSDREIAKQRACRLADDLTIVLALLLLVVSAVTSMTVAATLREALLESGKRAGAFLFRSHLRPSGGVLCIAHGAASLKDARESLRVAGGV